MKTQPTGEEVPLSSSSTILPYLPVYKGFLPKIAILPIIVLMLSTAALMAFPSGNPVLWVFFVLAFISIAAIIYIALQASQKKALTWTFLQEKSDEFVEAVSLRYGVVLTETILYRLAQGGKTSLIDKNGSLTSMIIESNPEAMTTKLVIAKN